MATLADRDPRSPTETPFYDATDPRPIDALIVHLCEVFFTQLSCNYPFLERNQFMEDLRGKKVDGILVDAICAIAARFSTHPMLTKAGSLSPDRSKGTIHKSRHGLAFAKHAMSRVTEYFVCPSIAAVQACLLLAYEQFGSDHDSGLWIWLGISIRLAQDLGLQKSDAVRHDEHLSMMIGRAKEEDSTRTGDSISLPRTESDPSRMEEKKINEKRRKDTFWAVFFLDRVISSGTGRPVTLRDTDIEIPFPSLDDVEPITGWPAPFPALIRILHLYGRVTDLLNSIQEINHMTIDTLQRLTAIENETTGACTEDRRPNLLIDVSRSLSTSVHETTFQCWKLSALRQELAGNKFSPSSFLVPYLDRPAPSTDASSFLWGPYSAALPELEGAILIKRQNNR